MSEMLEKFAGHVIAMLENVMVILFVLFVVAVIGFIFKSGSATRIERRLGALLRVEAKINLLLEHAGIEFDPYKSLPGDVTDAIERGEEIEAIRLWRGFTGAGLKEAKDFIEEVQRRRAVSGRG
jgi:hypothetical protein